MSPRPRVAPSPTGSPPCSSSRLRSPLHGLLSDGVLLITFTGRKSSKQYTTPINYLGDGDMIDLTTDSPWWKNLRSGVPLTLRIRRVLSARRPLLPYSLLLLPRMLPLISPKHT